MTGMPQQAAVNQRGPVPWPLGFFPGGGGQIPRFQEYIVKISPIPSLLIYNMSFGNKGSRWKIKFVYETGMEDTAAVSVPLYFACSLAEIFGVIFQDDKYIQCCNNNTLFLKKSFWLFVLLPCFINSSSLYCNMKPNANSRIWCFSFESHTTLALFVFSCVGPQLKCALFERKLR